MVDQPLVLTRLKAYSSPRIIVKNILWRIPKRTSSLNIIFVVGTPRSGTTLLHRILSVHSQLFGVNKETGIFSWRNIFEPSRNYFNLPSEKLQKLMNKSSDVVDFFDRAVKVLMEQNDAKIFVEKTPQNVLNIPFLLKYFPNASIVHIVRDGRDCYCSSKHHKGVPQNRSVRVFAKYWKKCVLVPHKFQQHDRLFTIKYENLVSNSEDQVSQMMAFWGLNREDCQLNPAILSQDRRANRPQFEKLKEPLNPQSIGRWQKDLSPQEIQTFKTIAGAELQLYGYPQ